MTFAPQDLLDVRAYLLHALGLPGDAVGIVGDPAHASSGGYHEGNNDLARVGHLTSDYSKRESARDRPGTDAASALDIGDHAGLRRLSLAIVDVCQRGDPRAGDIREVIYSPDGRVVRRWDRLGIRATGDSTHLWHTHLSLFRDSEGRRARADNLLGLLRSIIEGDDMPLDAGEKQQLDALDHRVHALATGARTFDDRPGDGPAREHWLVATLMDTATRVQATDARVRAALLKGTAVLDDVPGEGPGQRVWLVDQVAAIRTELAALAARPVVTFTPEQLAALGAQLAPALQVAAEAAVRRVLGGLDGATPPPGT